MELLKDLNPQTIAVIGAVWLLREVFGFIKGFIKQVTELRKGSDPDVSAILQAMQAIEENIKEQTDLTREFVSEFKLMKATMERVVKDVDDLKDEVRAGH